MSKNLNGINKPKPVRCYDTEWNYITTYASLRDCARCCKIPPTTLHRAIKEKMIIKDLRFSYDKN